MMNTKYVIVFNILIMVIWGNIFGIGFTKMDAIKAGQHLMEDVKKDNGTDFTFTLIGTALAVPDLKERRILRKQYHKLGMSKEEIQRIEQQKEDTPLKNVVRHHIWYNAYSKENNTAIGTIADLTTFIAADYSLGKIAHQVIPQQQSSFLYQNGKMVVASAAGCIAKTLVEEGAEGMTLNNSIKFGGVAALQVGAHAAAEGANLAADYFLGKEDSFKKEVLKCAFTFGAYTALNSVIGK